jgi:hypothetical protein
LLSIDLPLLLIHSLLLLVFLHFMSLKLVANESARSQAKESTDRRARPRTAHGTPNDTASSSAAQCSDSRSLFARG